MEWVDIVLLIAIILAIVAITYTIIEEQNLTRERTINKLRIEQLENTISVYKQSRTSLQEVASKALLGEACLLMALKERAKDDYVIGFKNANEWLKKRDELLRELDIEFSKPEHENPNDIYDSSLRITSMIYNGELDIKRD
jgi:hypothetical protein